MKEYNVNLCLPKDGERILCFGHRTYCCQDDMDEKADWHEVIFKFTVMEYKLKASIPEDPEESILEYVKVYEEWLCEPITKYGAKDHIIGVIKWKKL